MTDHPVDVSNWLRLVVAATGLKPTPFAKRAGVAPSTVLRALERDPKHELSTATIRSICNRFGVAPPGALPNSAVGPELLIKESNSVRFSEFLCNTHALDLAAILPGDELKFDGQKAAKSGDIVVGYVGNVVVLRMFDEPYLLTRSTRYEYTKKPQLVDNSFVRTIGVLVELKRRWDG